VAGSEAAQAGILYVTPFMHEDMAIVAAALLVAQHQLLIEVAAISLGAGMVSRDLMLYALGAAARRSGFARHLLIGPRVQHLGTWLGGNLVKVVMVSRVIPGLMFPAYIACGWFHVPFARYALVSMATTAVYLPIILGLALLFGQAAFAIVGGWAWLALAAPVAVAVILRIRAARRGRERLKAENLHA
jgi:membrane protein DedA with SNARE-associated domain